MFIYTWPSKFLGFVLIFKDSSEVFLYVIFEKVTSISQLFFKNSKTLEISIFLKLKQLLILKYRCRTLILKWVKFEFELKRWRLWLPLRAYLSHLNFAWNISSDAWNTHSTWVVKKMGEDFSQNPLPIIIHISQT